MLKTCLVVLRFGQNIGCPSESSSSAFLSIHLNMTLSFTIVGCDIRPSCNVGSDGCCLSSAAVILPMMLSTVLDRGLVTILLRGVLNI